MEGNEFDGVQRYLYSRSSVGSIIKRKVRHCGFIGVFVFIVIAAMSCGNQMTLKSVGTIDLDSMMVEAKPLVILTIYQNDVLPEKYNEIRDRIAEEYARKANASNWLLGDYGGGMFHIDQEEYESMVEEAAQKVYSEAWEEIQYIAKNNFSKEDFPFGDIEDKYVSEFIEFYFDTAEDVDARVVLSEPVLVKNEDSYATFTVTNTMDQTDYLIKLTDADEENYYIEVSEL